MDSEVLPPAINDALAQVCALPNGQHAAVIFAAHFCVAFIFAVVNYFGFTTNPNTKAATLFQAFINIVKAIFTTRRTP